MNDKAHIDFLILANHVEAVNGLLYITGGGWTDHHRPTVQGVPLTPNTHLGIGVSVIVPWIETNQQHILTVRVEDEDSGVVAQIQAHMNVGRPPLLKPGSEQPVMLGFPLDVPFPKTGEYHIVAELDNGTEMKRWHFRVHDLPITAPAQ